LEIFIYFQNLKSIWCEDHTVQIELNESSSSEFIDMIMTIKFVRFVYLTFLVKLLIAWILIDKTNI
jgi:hypothetical protein